MYISLRGVPGPFRGGSGLRGSHDAVPRAVFAIGFCSLLTDISSEAVAAVLPLYVTAGLGLSVFAYGVIDGLYQGASTLVRIPAGFVADRTDRPKSVAMSGYVLSALTRAGLLVTTGVGGLAALVTTDRVGKGIRTAPRDRLISLATEQSHLGRAFGVHRTLDTIGACLGPLIAFAVLVLLPGDYDAVFVVSLAAALLGIAVLALLVPNLRERRPIATPRRPIRQALTGQAASLVLVALPLSLLSIGDGLVYLVLLEQGDVDETWLPLLALGTSLVYLVTAYPVGALGDRIGRTRLFVLGHLPLVAAYLVLVFSSGGAATALLAVGALGLYYAATDGLLPAVSAEVAAPGYGATTIALSQTTTAVGRGLASVVFGALWVTIGGTAAILVFVIALAATVPTALVVIRRTGLWAH